MSFELIIFWGAVIVLGGFLLGGTFVVTRPQPEFAGHPKGLFLLFMAEMWERFSYYGMRALLIFYLVQHWMFSDSEASVIYGAYTALVYITPVVGGYLADRYLGQRKAVLFGAILLTFGHFFMAFEGNAASGADNPMINIFWLALALIIVGSGFLKANISVIVGQLYSRTDVRRDGAYTIFYMGINVGAATASLICGYLGQTYGWAYGFGLAGLGMLIGLVFFVLGKPLLMGNGEPKNPAYLRQRVSGIPREWMFYGIGLAMVALCWFMVQNQALVGILLGVFGAVLLAYVIGTAVIKLDREERDRIFAAMFLILTSIIFWALFEQAGSSLNLFTDRHVDRAGVPASMFQSVNAIYIILLAPLFAVLWTFLDKRRLEPSSPAKFGIGLILCGAGFLVLVAGAAMAGQSLTPVIFVFLIYLLHTMAELCFSPVGLSAMTRLSVSNMVGLVMGTWFLAMAAGNFIAGLIARATGSGEAGDVTQVLDVYSRIGWFSVVVGGLVLLVSPYVKRMMHLDLIAAEKGKQA